MSVRILIGDMRERLREVPDASVDSCVCDPPYHLTSIVKRYSRSNLEQPADKDLSKVNAGAFRRLAKGFMGQTWDGGDVAFDPETWAEVYRVLKPGAHLVAFSGTRTYHRMVCAIEDAGFEVRDQLAWVYGTGFPKSHDVAKAITKRVEPEVLLEIKAWLSNQFEASGKSKTQINRECGFTASDYLKTEPGEDAGGRATWHLLLPYGTKWARLREVVGFDDRYDAEIERLGVIASQRAQPKANKDIYGAFSGVVTDYELTDPAQEWQGWGTALKPAWEPICLARKPLAGTIAANVLAHGTGAINIDGCRIHADDAQGGEYEVKRLKPGATLNKTGGNWRPEEGGEVYRGEVKPGRWPANIIHDGSEEVLAAFPDAPGALYGVGPQHAPKTGTAVYGDYGPRPVTNPRGDSGSAARFFYCAKATTEERGEGNNHPTVKPVELMRWLCRLVTPKGGTVLDPFMGSGSTMIAADAEQFNGIGCELSPEYAAIAERRIRNAAGMFAEVKAA